MIHIRQRPVPRSRTHTGSLWVAMAEIGGETYHATSRHGAPQALARVLLSAGIPDQAVEVRSEVCVLDNGAEIRTEELRGCIRYRSLHALAKWTFTEGAATLLHRVRYQAQREGVFSSEASGQKCVSSPPVGTLASAERSEGLAADGGTGQKCVSEPAFDVVEVPPPDGRETQAPATRRCEGCESDFLPARAWSRFCCPACRLRTYRRLTRQDENVAVVVERPRREFGQEALAE
jgi:hypothetical protein